MSQVATYVEGVDGRYYICPIIYTDDWYVCFNDDDPPEIVVRHHKSEKGAESRAKKFLRDAGFKFRDFKFKGTSGRMFPPEWKLTQASSAFFEILEPFPVENVKIHSDGDSEIMPDITQGTVIIWNRDFLVSELKKLWILNSEVSETVLTYLGGSRQKCRNTIKKQYPQFPEGCEELIKLRVRN